MAENSKIDVTGIERRLDALIRIALDSRTDQDEEVNLGDQILMLEDAGLLPSEAGSVLGIDSGQLTKYIKNAKNNKLREKVANKRKRGSP
jgi:hypothetical protein